MNRFDFDSVRALMKARRSKREFLPDPVPRSELNAVFEAASYAPSNCNSQPWKVVVVDGERATEVKKILIETVGKGEIKPDFVFDVSVYPEVQIQRMQAAAELMYGAAGIARDDKSARNQFIIDNLNFFGAPNAAFFFLPDWAGERGAADLGMYAQNVMLAMCAKGIGTCPQTILSFNAGAVRECLGIDASYKLLFGLSFGYYCPDKPLNQVSTERADIESSVTFME